MTEEDPTKKEQVPTREEVVGALKKVRPEGAELMRAYMEALISEKGDSKETRLEVEFEQVNLYYDAEQFHEAQLSAEDFLTMAQGEQEFEWEDRISRLIGIIDRRMNYGGGSRESH